MNHKHCVFCGENAGGSTVCHSKNNTLTPDSSGHKSHSFQAVIEVKIPRDDWFYGAADSVRLSLIYEMLKGIERKLKIKVPRKI